MVIITSDNLWGLMSEELANELGLSNGMTATNELANDARPPAIELESVTTLRTVAEIVRGIVHADTTGIVSLSLAEQSVTWKATSGFLQPLHESQQEIVSPLQATFEKGARQDEIIIIEKSVAGQRAGFSLNDFPLLSTEGVVSAALAPLSMRDEVLDALIVGFRAPHQFTATEKVLLRDLTDMVALALENARLVETIGTAKKIWEQTFDAIPDGVIVHNGQMQIVRCNAHAAEMMEMSPAQAIGVSCADAFARLFGERAAAYHMGQGLGAASSFELQAEDGRRYLVSVAPLETGGAQAGSVITWSDVTELSEMQEQLSRSRRLATVGQLAAGVAHEINNPLAAINTCAEAVIRDLSETVEITALAAERDWNYYLEEIIRQVFRCKEITRGLLDLARQRRARRVTCDLNMMAAEAARLTEERAQSETVKIIVELDENVGEIATDEGMVRQVLDNLLSNALDAVGEDGQITLSTQRAGERIAIEVGDTGHGIAPEMLVRIFDPFFTTKDPGKGSGLGLAICYTLAEALGGALTVESKMGAGSRFRLWLPRRAPEQEETKRAT